MMLENRFQFTPDLQINCLLNGMWQVSGAHGQIEPKSALASMFQYWDLADHYNPAEDLIGFRRLLQTKGQEAYIQLQAFTNQRARSIYTVTSLYKVGTAIIGWKKHDRGKIGCNGTYKR